MITNGIHSNGALMVGLLAAASLALAGCDRGPTEPEGAQAGPDFAKRPPAPGYVQLALDAEPGQVDAEAYDINDSHHVVGTIQYADRLESGFSRGAAFFWSEAGGGSQAQLLPNLPNTAVSAAFDINEAGEVAGASGSGLSGEYVAEALPVIWQSTGSGWTVRQLEASGLARGLNDHGEAVGHRANDPDVWKDEPVHWSAAGAATVLPIPSGYERAHATRINNDGDIAGMATTPAGVQWAVLWLRTGTGEWTPVVLNGGAIRGLTDRSVDGTLLATGDALTARSQCCQAVRWIVTIDPSTGAVEAAREYLGTDYFKYGGGEALNAAGDVGGFGIPGNNWAGTPQPALFNAGASTVKLPIGRNSKGSANGISIDRWLAGSVDGLAVVWRPSS